jgi:nucleoside-diphosphate-sugar epimerase
MTVLVTGANGFVGSALCRRLLQDGTPVRAAVRSPEACSGGVSVVEVAGLAADTDWSPALQDVEQVVHLAARVHVMQEYAGDPLAQYRRVNVEGTVRLARQAAAAGVRRFVFLSSIKVNGESTQLGHAFTADDVPMPEDPYGVSKLEAEWALHEVARQTGMELVIVRPPLVYGPGVKANFGQMMRVLSRGWPLPLGAVTDNRRSLVALGNLVDLIVTCLHHPNAANQTFLVSDGEDLSTAGLLRRLGDALGRPARLVPVPVGLLKLGFALMGRPGLHQRLCGSLQVDMVKTRQLLGWEPPLTVDEGLRSVSTRA